MSKQTFKLDGKSATMYLGKQKESPVEIAHNKKIAVGGVDLPHGPYNGFSVIRVIVQ